MNEKPVALLTGANKGIGLQIAKDLSVHGLTVVVGSRSLEAGESAAQSVGSDARAVQLDVTDQDSIADAASRIRDELGRLDVLVNNAGISRAEVPGRSFDQAAATDPLSVASLDEVRTVFETNVFGVIAVTQAVLPLLRESPSGRIVNIASSAGSLTLNSDPATAHRWMFGTYSASKAASHAVTVAQAPVNSLTAGAMNFVRRMPRHHGTGPYSFENVPVGPSSSSSASRTGSRAASSTVRVPRKLLRSVAVKTGHAALTLMPADSSSAA